MEKVRFEVILNGKRLCIAGLDGYGVLLVTMVVATQLEPDRANTEKEPHALVFDINFGVGGLESSDSTGDQHILWVNRTLQEGDDVRIRILPEGEHDPPAWTLADFESLCMNQDDNAKKDCEFPPDDPSIGEVIPGNVRLAVSNNGSPLCTAGIDGRGLISVHISAVTHHPDCAKQLRTDGKSYKDRLSMGVRGLDDTRPELRSALLWVPDKTLSPGDQVRVQLLPPGEYDPPTRSASPNKA